MLCAQRGLAQGLQHEAARGLSESDRKRKETRQSAEAGLFEQVHRFADEHYSEERRNQPLPAETEARPAKERQPDQIHKIHIVKAF